MTGAWRELAAGHEAGHVVVAYHYGAHIDHIKIGCHVLPDGRAEGGMTACGPLLPEDLLELSDPGYAKRQAAKRSRITATVLIAGFTATTFLQKIDSDRSWRAANRDLDDLEATGISQADLERRHADARSILLKRQKQWQRLYARLLTVDELSWREIQAVLTRRHHRT